jgi:hypothetical protein
MEKLCLYVCMYVYKETKLDNQINDRNTVTPNTLFDAIIRSDVSTRSTAKPPRPDKTTNFSNKLPPS